MTMRQRPLVSPSSLPSGVTPINLAEYETLAREKIEPTAWDYIVGGAEDERSVTENRTAYSCVRLRPRVLVDVSKRDLSTTVFGQTISMPVMLAPISTQTFAHPDGELAVAHAAETAGVITILGIGNHYSMEEVAAASNANRWFQLYCFNNHNATEWAVRRAEESGCQGLVITVDGSDRRRHERLLRRPLIMPPGVKYGNLWGIGLQDELMQSEGGVDAWIANLKKMDLTWKDITWIKSITRLPVVIKGIMSPTDARLAANYGIDGIVVSNHGGRQVDGTIPPILALPEIADAVGGKLEIFIDGGIRRGADVLKALALGAKAVLIGRPYLYGLAVNGEAGVRHVLEILRTELDSAMCQTGQADVKKVHRSLVTII